MEKDIIVSEGNLPFMNRCIAAVFYLICFGIIGDICFKVFSGADAGAIISSLFNIGIGLVTLSLALRYSLIRNIYIRISDKAYKQEYAVGPFVFGKWKPLPDVEYISVFRQGWSKDSDGDGISDLSGHNFDVNVWHNTSKHFTIYSSAEPEPAFEMGRYIAIKLQVDLLDATVPNDSKWVELENAGEEQTASS